jgi:uncharacterized repeat protein (TIGR02543 family)
MVSFVPFPPTRKRSDGMTRVSVAIVAAAGAMLGAVTAFAEQEKVGDYTWSYEIANGEAVILGYATDPVPAGDIQIPASLGGCPVTALGDYAFKACSSITSVTMPKGVRTIGNRAFLNCSAISNVTFSPMTTSIGDSAFYGCSSLKSLVLPHNVVNIADSAFHYCRALTNVTFSPMTTNIGELAFSECLFKSLVLPDNVVNIASKAFFGCEGLTNITVGAGTMSIGGSVFCECISLERVRMPRTLEAAVNADPSIFEACPHSLVIEYYDVTAVTLDANGGVGGGKVQLRKGGTLAGRVLPAATREGYAFAGWWTKRSGGKKLSTKTKFTKGATYYAHWTPRKYPVKLAKSGKGSVSGAGKKAYRSKATVKAKAAKGYVFQGWYKITNNVQGIVNSGEGTGEELVSQKAKYTFKVPLGGVTLKAKFITKAQDRAAIGMTLDGTGVGASEAVAGAALPVLTNMCGVVLSVPLAAAGLTPVKVTAKNLPTGLKYDAKKKAIVGAPRSARTFTVRFTVKSAGASRTWSAKWVITPLPDYAKGNFCNYKASALNDSAFNLFKLSVTSSGKISGRLQEYGTNWTLNASSYDVYVSDKKGEGYIATNVTATYAYKVTKKVKGKKKSVTKYITRKFMFIMSEDLDSPDGVATLSGIGNEGEFVLVEDEDGKLVLLEEPVGERILIFRDFWATRYAAFKKLFYTSKKKQFRTYKIAGGSANGNAMGLDPTETLTLKIKPSGDVTAVMAFDTGRTTKNKKTGKMEKVIYKATCTAILIPIKSEEDGSTKTAVYLYFAPNETYGYPGYRNTFGNGKDDWFLLFWPGGKFAVQFGGIGD